MILNAIQSELQSLYQVSCGECVEDYLLDGEKPALFLSKHPWLAQSDEALLVEQAEESLELGLWFKPELFQWGQRQDWGNLKPEEVLEEKSLPKWAALVEGVSHFVYLLSKAREERPVTQLELELQAEVDKFVLLSRCLGDAPIGVLLEGLFANVQWNPGLAPQEQERYSTALKLASRYCDHLKQQRFPLSERDLLPELRAFYRMNQAEKIRHIA